MGTKSGSILEPIEPIHECFFIRKYEYSDQKHDSWTFTVFNNNIGRLVKKIHYSTPSDALKEYKRLMSLRTYLICG